MNALTTVLDHVSPGGAYAIVALAILAESVLLVGAFVPTLTLLLTAGALARTEQLSLPLLIATTAPAVIAGDFLAYRTGRALCPSLRTGRLGRRLPAAAWRRTETLMARCGGHAVFLGPLPAGDAHPCPPPRWRHLPALPPHRPYSVAAAPLWTTLEVGTGYAAAASLQHALTLGGPVLAATTAAVAAAAFIWKCHCRAREPETATEPAGDLAHSHK